MRIVFIITICYIVAGFNSLNFAQKKQEPLPLDAVASFKTTANLNIDLSPDGKLVAYTTADHSYPLRSFDGGFTPTGVLTTGGTAKLDIWVSDTESGKSINLGDDSTSSWGGSWSPNGNKLAFYSDRKGQANIWVWDKNTNITKQVTDAVARPYWGSFHYPVWSSDSKKLLCKILPQGITVREANDLIPKAKEIEFPPIKKEEPSVFLLKSLDETGEQNSEDRGWINMYLSDLALIEIDDGTIKRIASNSPSNWYSFSPDGKLIGFTIHQGWQPNTQQALYNILVYNLTTGKTTTVASKVSMQFGISVSWSPDSKLLSYTTAGQMADGDCYIVPVDGSTHPKKLSESTHPPFSADFLAPLWDNEGKYLYFLGNGNLWRISLYTGLAEEFSKIHNHSITGIIAPIEGGRFVSADNGKTMIVTTRNNDNMMEGFYKIDLRNGKAGKLAEANQHIGSQFNIDISKDGDKIVYSKESAKHPADLYITSYQWRETRRITRLNPELDKYEMGKTQLVEWKSLDGRELKGTLLLPAYYKEGKSYPLVVWVYGGSMGSVFLNRFGGWGLPVFNIQVLATRGYAVLFPDTPLRLGIPMQDLYYTVMPGVNKLIELGIADENKLVVMGQSFGSYCTLALIAQDTRFKAAVITAVVESNYTNGYLYMNKDGTAGSIGYYEKGQGGMGGTLWEYPERYIKNSPLFLFDKVETPLLMAHGSEDPLPLSWPDHTFVALRRLGKEVEYAIYGGESHVISRFANVVDFWRRRLGFFDKHLNKTK